LRQGLVGAIGTDDAKLQFADLQKHQCIFAPFTGTWSLVGFLLVPGAGIDEKDALYRVLLETARARTEPSRLAATLIWLGLWPALDRLYCRYARDVADENELASELAFHFVRQIHRVELARTKHLAPTIVLNVRRDVAAWRARLWSEAIRQVALLDDTLERDENACWPPCQIAPSDPDHTIEALRTWLRRAVGQDAEVVLATAVLGVTEREVAERMGLRYEAIRKRFQRAMRRIRRRVGRRGRLVVPEKESRGF
jgi:RNA polymerase sigma-70 factor (ECF subfamily)